VDWKHNIILAVTWLCDSRNMPYSPCTTAFFIPVSIYLPVLFANCHIPQYAALWTQLKATERSLSEVEKSYTPSGRPRHKSISSVACRATYTFIAPSLHVCFKSSFPSLTVFFFFRGSLGWGACQMQPASHRLTIYLGTQQTPLSSVAFCGSHWSE